MLTKSGNTAGPISRFMEIIFYCILASPDALEVIVVTYLLTYSVSQR